MWGYIGVARSGQAPTGWCDAGMPTATAHVFCCPSASQRAHKLESRKGRPERAMARQATVGVAGGRGYTAGCLSSPQQQRGATGFGRQGGWLGRRCGNRPPAPKTKHRVWALQISDTGRWLFDGGAAQWHSSGACREERKGRVAPRLAQARSAMLRAFARCRRSQPACVCGASVAPGAQARQLPRARRRRASSLRRGTMLI